MPCPVGADCSDHDGMLVVDLVALPGYWRSKADTLVFSPCVEGYSSLDAQDLATARCCPIDLKNNVSICKHNLTAELDAQCLTGYSGPLCLVCAAGYVKQNNECSKCAGGATIGFASIPIAVMSVVLFGFLMVYFLGGKNADDAAKKGSQWFGQLVSCGCGSSVLL